MIHFPEAVIMDHNNVWSEKTPANIIIFLEDARNLLEKVNAPSTLIQELDAYLETLDHSLDQDTPIDDMEILLNKDNVDIQTKIREELGQQ